MDRRYADDHLAELTDRQRRVLDLIVAGKTNAQIGEALGITLDGAKWNVSEILTRLGFSSREEAAEYWRSRGRIRKQLGRPLQALLAMPLAVKAAGAAGAVAVAAVAVAVIALSPGGGEAPKGSAAPFYMEGTMYFEGTMEGPIGPGGGSPGGLSTPRREIRWWYASQSESRTEMAYFGGENQSGPMLIVADGSAYWAYSSAENVYTRSDLPKVSDAVAAQAIGPFAGPIRERTVDEFLAAVRGRGSPPNRAAIVGSGEVLGWPIVIIEIKALGTVSRLWVDPEPMFVRGGEMGSLHTEVTTIRYNEPIPRDRLRFDPPPGARLVESLGSSSGGTASFNVVPTGFSTPAYIAAGYSVRGTTLQPGSGTGQLAGIELTYSRDDAALGHIWLKEQMQAGGLPDSARTGERISVNGREAYRSDPYGITSITWADSDLMIVLSTNALTFDELLRMAESVGR